jgi:actin-related protein 9
MGFREDNVVVIEVGSLTTRAVVGLAESMTPPQVRVPTKIGVKRVSQGNPRQRPQYLFDEELEDAIRAKDPDMTVIQPIVKGVVRDWEAIEIFW